MRLDETLIEEFARVSQIRAQQLTDTEFTDSLLSEPHEPLPSVAHSRTTDFIISEEMRPVNRTLPGEFDGTISVGDRGITVEGINANEFRNEWLVQENTIGTPLIGTVRDNGTITGTGIMEQINTSNVTHYNTLTSETLERTLSDITFNEPTGSISYNGWGIGNHLQALSPTDAQKAEEFPELKTIEKDLKKAREDLEYLTNKVKELTEDFMGKYLKLNQRKKYIEALKVR